MNATYKLFNLRLSFTGVSDGSRDEKQNHRGLKKCFQEFLPIMNFFALKWSLFSLGRRFFDDL